MLSDWQWCSVSCFSCWYQPGGVGSPAGKWLQAAYSHQDVTWMQLEEERKVKPRGWYLDFGKLASPYQGHTAGSCHPFLLWGLHAVVRSSAAFLETCEDIAPKLQCREVAMCLLTHLYVKEQQRPVVSQPRSQQLLWSPAGWLCIDKSGMMFKCNSGVGLKFN